MKITIIATGFEKKPEDENRTSQKIGVTGKTKPEQKTSERGDVFTKPEPKPVSPAPDTAGAVKRPIAKPAPKRPAAPADDDDFDDILNLVKKKK